ncbi:MAG TPA: phosphotransferase [Rhodothermales bacterium]
MTGGLLHLRDAVDRLSGKETALKGGVSTKGVVRVGDTVRRPVKDSSSFVHDLLGHLEKCGFDRVPRFLGIDEKGREILSHIDGTVFQRVGGFEKEQWTTAASLLRSFHDATVDCALKGECEVICHGDSGPGNWVMRDGLPFALIDFDSAHPGRREEDVGYAAWMWLHIGNPRIAPEEHGSNLRDFIAAYDRSVDWNPVRIVLEAQKTCVDRIPNNFKWGAIKVWAQGCLAWTYKHRARIAAGAVGR